MSNSSKSLLDVISSSLDTRFTQLSVKSKNKSKKQKHDGISARNLQIASDYDIISSMLKPVDRSAIAQKIYFGHNNSKINLPQLNIKIPPLRINKKIGQRVITEQKVQPVSFLNVDDTNGSGNFQFDNEKTLGSSPTIQPSTQRYDRESGFQIFLQNSEPKTQKNIQNKSTPIAPPSLPYNKPQIQKNLRIGQSLKTAGGIIRRGFAQPVRCLDILKEKEIAIKNDLKKQISEFGGVLSSQEIYSISPQSSKQQLFSNKSNHFHMVNNIEISNYQSNRNIDQKLSSRNHFQRMQSPQSKRFNSVLILQEDHINNRNHFVINKRERGLSLKPSSSIQSMQSIKFVEKSQTNSSLSLCSTLLSLAKVDFTPPKKEIVISDEEKKLYGDRFLDGYTKINLLGKGGFALVWLAEKENNRYAVKQITRQNGSDSYLREIRVCSLFFKENGDIKQEYEQYPGINQLLKCIEVKQYPKDVFMVYQLGGTSLSQYLYSMKGEFYKGERLYKINFTGLHEELFQTKRNNFLKSLLQKLLEQLELLALTKIIHCDIKPENILVEIDKSEFKKVSLIDFGSSFSLDDKGQVGMATLEYLPPEMLEIFKGSQPNNSKISSIEKLSKMVHPFSIDTWCVGSSLLEVLTGVPHWLSYKCRVIDYQSNKSSIKQGLFFTKAQDYDKIIQKQQQFCDNYSTFIKEITRKFDCSKTAKQFSDLIKKMMLFNPFERISPINALKHPFFNNNISSQNDQQSYFIDKQDTIKDENEYFEQISQENEDLKEALSTV